MIDNPIIFYPAAFFIISFAMCTLFAKNVIYSLLSAVIVFFFGALFFYMLGSEYNAIIQAAVYGLAVPIIIGLSIMFAPSNYNTKEKSFLSQYLTLMCSAIFILAFVYLVMMSLAIIPDTFRVMESIPVNHFDTILSFAKGIFIDYVWAFELISLLLTIIIAGIGLLRTKKGAIK